MLHPSPRRTAVAIAAAFTVAACSQPTAAPASAPSGSAPTSAAASNPTTTSVPELAPTGAPGTTSPSSTEPPATTTISSQPSPSTAPPTTAAPSSVPSPSVPTSVAAAPSTAFITLLPAFVELDLASGAVVRTIDEFFSGEGLFRSALRVSADRSNAWFSEGYEDGWYGCESSVGQIGRIDLTTGAVEMVAAGGLPEPSPDGTRVAYVDSEVCSPDPEAPANWVVTPMDRVVVRDVASGDEVEFVTAPTPVDGASPSTVSWAGFTGGGTLLALTADGDLRSIDPTGSPVLQDHPVVASGVGGSPVGVIGDLLLVTVTGDEGAVELVAVDAAGGGRARLASSERFFDVGVDAASGTVLAAGYGEIAVEPGAPVTVLDLPDGAFFSTLDW